MVEVGSNTFLVSQKLGHYEKVPIFNRDFFVLAGGDIDGRTRATQLYNLG